MRVVALLGVCIFAYVLPGCGGSSGADGTGGTGGIGGACDESCASPSDFSGTWTGTYLCTPTPSTCGDPFGGDITIEVMQEGRSATYTDGTDTFAGCVCGDEFVYEKIEGPEEYTESGTLTLTSPTTAMKESTYQALDGSGCTGDCEDSFSR